ncbi:hypothetical protein [Robiginitomaculum antarcticum]|uniref:hypothetical protein n=1 Tax=Robiginitomaculum antarcticum TaxID=437507 RepID=UPI0012EA99A7|nr:hypothetical protein [Robiginitomaculum antarcticum]
MTRLLLLSCFTAALALSACGKSEAPKSGTSAEVTIEDPAPRIVAIETEEERVADRVITEMETIINALDGVTDEDSARDAAAIINAAGQRIQAEANMAQTELDNERFKAAMDARRQEVEAFEDSMENTLKRLLFKPKLGMILAKELAKLDWSWMDMDTEMPQDEETPKP